MNLRKFISGVSALTIAASAFAGLAVTANAAYVPVQGTEVTDTGSSVANSGETSDDHTISGFSNFTSGIVEIIYHVKTDVDYTNTRGNRAGWITLKGTSNNETVYIADFYANTAKGSSGGTGAFTTPKQANYAIGQQIGNVSGCASKATSLSTALKEFDYDIFVDLDEDKVWGSITNTDNSFEKVITETSVSVDAITGFELYALNGNSMTLSGISAKQVTEQTQNYTLTTEPYAKVTINDNVYYSDANGDVNVTNLVEDGDDITVEKTGYVNLTGNVDTVNGNNITGFQNVSGRYYTEDFMYVRDTFGFSENSGVTTSGALNVSIGSGSVSTTSITDTSVSDRAIYLDLTSLCASTNHTGYLSLDGTGLRLYLYGGSIRVHGVNAYNNGANTGFGSSGQIYIIIDSSNKKAHFYNNGMHIGDVYATGTELTGLTATQASGTFQFRLNEIAVMDKPSTYNVTVNGSSKAYIANSTYTLASAPIGYSWVDGNGDAVDAGEKTVNGALTFRTLANSGTKAFSFSNIPIEDFSTKKIKVTVIGGTEDGNVKTGDLSGKFNGEGTVNFGIVITELPTDADSITAVFE